MATASATVAARANSGTDHLVGKSTPSGRLTAAAMQKARSLWPHKTAAEVAVRAHVSVRSAERWLAGERELSADAIAHLLRSDQGIHFLVALMDKARPAWWSMLLRMGLLGGIQRRREADLRLLRRMADVTDEVARPVIPAALMVQDPEFFEPLFEAAVAVAGAPDSPVGKRGRP